MDTSAVIMMIFAIVTIWGGAAFCVSRAMKKQD